MLLATIDLSIVTTPLVGVCSALLAQYSGIIGGAMVLFGIFRGGPWLLSLWAKISDAETHNTFVDYWENLSDDEYERPLHAESDPDWEPDEDDENYRH